MGRNPLGRGGVALVCAMAVLGLGCQTLPPGYEGRPQGPSRTARSAVLGSLAGAAIGAGLDHRNRGRGAIVGALGGLLAGAVLGAQVERYEDAYEDRAYGDHDYEGETCEEEELESRREPVPPPLTFGPGEVLFDPGSAALSRGAQSKLRRLADEVRERRDLELALHGHSDASQLESRFELSEQRAHVVRAFLVDEGLAPRRMVVVGFGDARPVATNRNAAGRQRNRRVEIVVRERVPYS